MKQVLLGLVVVLMLVAFDRRSNFRRRGNLHVVFHFSPIGGR